MSRTIPYYTMKNQTLNFIDNRPVTNTIKTVCLNSKYPIQRSIRVKFDQSGNPIDQYQQVKGQTLYRYLVDTHGIPSTNKLITVMKRFDTDNCSFESHRLLIQELINLNIPIESVTKQKDNASAIASVGHNVGNAKIILDYPNNDITTDQDIKVYDIDSRTNGQRPTTIYDRPDVGYNQTLIKDIEISINDTEVSLCDSIHKVIIEQGDFINQYRPRIYIRVYSFLGPCNACKSRLMFLKSNIESTFKYDTKSGTNCIDIDIFYDIKEKKVSRGDEEKKVKTSYGWDNDIKKNNLWYHRL